jgi:hypothetical protein
MAILSRTRRLSEEKEALRIEGNLSEQLQDVGMLLVEEKGEILKKKIAAIREDSSRKRMAVELQREEERAALDRMVVEVWAGVVDPSQRELAQDENAGLTSVEELLFEEQFVSSVQALAMDWGQEMDEHTPLGNK